ncbi:storkhead-box protein 1-like [Numida meleagris]|uniref:storkhead-box protein 1-like n=1 Tax=Numida meleagris TaxID=8996 RepID=UPI000B3E0DDB|nr:storkhead-box protein 1-like [Numida meleagris]
MGRPGPVQGGAGPEVCRGRSGRAVPGPRQAQPGAVRCGAGGGGARRAAMPRRVERCLQIAPHSLAIVLSPEAGGRPAGPGAAAELGRHRIGYEIFADFKRENMQHFWDQRATAAVAETFFLGWIDEQVLLVQGKEEHLEVLRQGWARRSLKPPSGFHIKCLDPLTEESVHSRMS